MGKELYQRLFDERLGERRIVEQIATKYPGVTIESIMERHGIAGFPRVRFSGKDKTLVDYAADDFEFYQRHGYGFEPHNMPSRFENFKSYTASQRRAFQLAQRFASIDASERAAGLYLWGTNGVGKTHLAMSVGKQWEVQSRTASTHVSGAKIKDDSYYDIIFSQNPDERKTSYRNRRRIIDDLNTQGFASEHFVPTLDGMFTDQKGVMLVTSNVSPGQLFTSLFGSGGDNMHYTERFRTLFHVVEINGKSARPDASW